MNRPKIVYLSKKCRNVSEKFDFCQIMAEVIILDMPGPFLCRVQLPWYALAQSLCRAEGNRGCVLSDFGSRRYDLNG